jgi:tyrosinase
MEAIQKVKVRVSITDLQTAYEKGNKAPLEDVMRAWKGIKELPATDPNSFFMLGGFHGEPFRGAGWGSSTFWGGFCNHGNVLFPTWHRVYLFKLEQALQSIKGCENVMLPYWDETSDESLKNGIPWALTNEFFELDGKKIDNPLRSFKFPVSITDNVSTDDGLYSKPAGYETVRYPYTGLAGTPEIYAESKKTNSQWPYTEGVKMLNQNVVAWLNQTVVFPPPPVTTPPTPPTPPQKIGIHNEFKKCLNAPNYTVFSNTTSAQQWNDDLARTTNQKNIVVPLEQPHNDIHLSVGGFNVPSQGPDFSPNGIANGDMGENDTAGLDPIFYFHHCNVDRMFWLWQKKWKNTNQLEIIPEYPGTNSSDNQGATPGVAPNSWLTLQSPLTPFKHKLSGATYTSMDCINIEKQLGYTYSKGSLDDFELMETKMMATPQNNNRILRVAGINRAPINGSFLVSSFATINGEKYYLGSHSVLSRWAVKGCANCQTHLEVKAHFSLQHLPENVVENADFHIEIAGREHSNVRLQAVLNDKKYRVDVI